jgi:hypothetical protein
MTDLTEFNLGDEYAEHLETEIEFIHVEFANQKMQLMKEAAEQHAKLVQEIEMLKAENHRLVVLNRVFVDRLTKLKKETKLNVISE